MRLSAFLSDKPCPSCGAPLRWHDLTCRQCGAKNDTLRQWLEGAAVVAVLLVAIGIGSFIAMRYRPSDAMVQAQAPAPQMPAAPSARPAPEAPSPPSSPAQEPAATPPSTSSRDFAWLERAMSECEAQADKDKNNLYWLVVPVVANATAGIDWQALARTVIGNAIILGGKDTLAGLRGGSLTIASEPYTFSLRFAPDQPARRWDGNSGVKRFMAEGLGTTRLFRMQIKSEGKGRDDAWGNLFEHQAGTCYWVIALPT